MLSSHRIRIKEPSGRMHCGPGWRRTREDSLGLSDAEFWLVWKGSGTMSDGQNSLVLYPGFCAVMRPGGIYDAESEAHDPLGITFIHFDLEEAKGRAPRIVTGAVCREWPEYFRVADLAFFDAISRRIVQRFLQSPATAELLLRGLLAELLQSPRVEARLDADGPASLHRRRILQLVDEIRSGQVPLELSVNDLAGLLHLSPSHFSRLFRDTVGRSPLQFLLEVRLSRARRLLRETDLSIGEIAGQLGYRDLFFFSRQFMQKEGIPPTEYRAARPMDGSLSSARKR